MIIICIYTILIKETHHPSITVFNDPIFGQAMQPCTVLRGSFPVDMPFELSD